MVTGLSCSTRPVIPQIGWISRPAARRTC